MLLLAGQLGLDAMQTQTSVYITLATMLVIQCFLIGVRSPWAQGPRLRRMELWAAAGISFALLLAGAYLPGLRGALDLARPTLADLGRCAATVFVAANVAQVAAVIATRAWRNRLEGMERQVTGR